MEVLTFAIITVLSVLISVWLSRRKCVKNPLPGPTGIPIVGYLPFMSRKPYLNLTELKKQYGPVYSIRLGSENVVAICDFKLIREAFMDDAFMGRPPDIPFELSEETIRTKAYHGMPFKEQRRFCLHMLRDLGFGKTTMEDHIKEEILELIERMSKLVQTPVKMSNIIAPSMSNNIASLLFGKRLKYDDPMRKELDRVNSEIGRLASGVGWQIFFPSIGAIAKRFNIGNKGKLIKAIKEVEGYCRKELVEHEETLDPNNIRDFMDGYLLEIQKKCNDPDSTFNKQTLLDLSRAFFGAGSETVRISVDWMLLCCAAFPEVQKRIHTEIDEILGRERFPSGQDRFSMPYTEAAICEVMRWKSIIPINILRYTLKDTKLNDYFIPKHSKVLAVIWAVHHDKALWGKDVDVYRPDRFLSEDGRKVVKPDYYIPFSIGKRACPGKSLGEMEVFLYVSAILQKFELSMPPGKEADFEPVIGVSLQPKRQELCLKLRH